MVTVYRTRFTAGNVRPDAVCLSVVYAGKRYLINIWGEKTTIIDIDDKKIISREQEKDTIAIQTRYIVHYYSPPKLKVRTLYGRRGQIIIADDIIELTPDPESIRIEQRREVKTIKADWLDRWEDIAHGIVLPPYLALLPDWNRGDAYYVNVWTEKITKIDLGPAVYENQYRFSHKVVIDVNDIKMLAGKHLAGSEHEIWYVYQRKRQRLFSTGGGSPRPCMYGIIIFSDQILIPATSGGVINTNNDIAILDCNFNRIGTIRSRDIFDFSNAWPFGHIFAKTKDGGYLMIAGGNDNPGSYARRAQIWLVKLRSNFTVERKWKILDTDVTFESYANAYPGYSDITSAPIIDLERKKIYLYTTTGNFKTSDYLIEIDISDLLGNIKELNQVGWYTTTGKVTTPKIPTKLKLKIEQ